MFPAGSVLMAMYGATIGACSILGIEAATNQACCAFLPTKQVLPDYLYYYLSSIKASLIKRGVGGAQPNISGAILKDTPFPLISLPEQKQIVEILDLADEARRKRRENLSLTDDLIRSLFLQTFGDPVSNPMGWKERKLGSMVAVDAPMVDPRKDEYLDLLHIGPDRIEKETGHLLPAKTAREDQLISGKFLFDDRYVLYSKIRPYLRKVALPNFSGLCSADVYPVRPLDNELTREYLWQLLLSVAFLKYTESLPSRANIPKLNRTELDAYLTMKPDYDLQLKFSKKVQEINLQKAREQALYDQHDDLFNSLLQRAFKGEL